MKHFAIALVSSLTIASVAYAQGKTTSPAPTAPAAPTSAPAKPMPPAAPSAPAATAPAGKPAPMAMPGPAPEIAAMAKEVGGTWKCTGKMMMPDGSEQPAKATITNKLNKGLGGFWIDTTFVQPGKNGFAFNAYTTYNTSAKTWHRVHVDSMGGQEVTTSEGPKDNKVLWSGTATGMMGTASSRHYEEMLGKKEVKMWGEYSMDKGKSWMKAYEVTCKR